MVFSFIPFLASGPLPFLPSVFPFIPLLSSGPQTFLPSVFPFNPLPALWASTIPALDLPFYSLSCPPGLYHSCPRSSLLFPFLSSGPLPFLPSVFLFFPLPDLWASTIPALGLPFYSPSCPLGLYHFCPRSSRIFSFPLSGPLPFLPSAFPLIPLPALWASPIPALSLPFYSPSLPLGLSHSCPLSSPALKGQ